MSPNKPTVRTCRVCGCTDDDCSGCIERTGLACHWVAADLCSACLSGFSVLMRVKRGTENIASVRVGNKTYRCSCTSSELQACQGAAAKAAAAVRASSWRVVAYRSISQFAGHASLFLSFAAPERSEEGRAP